MIGMMIFVVENEFQVQLGFDSLDLRPSESARLFKRLRMSNPLLITKAFKLTMQCVRKSMSLEPCIGKGFRPSLPIIFARKKCTGSTGQCNAALIRQQRSEFLQSGCHMTLNKAMVR